MKKNLQTETTFRRFETFGRFAVALVIFLIAGIAHSQSFTVFDIDKSDFPVMRAKFYAIDENGEEIRNQNIKDFEIKENGENREVISVSCPAPKPLKALSSVLTIDVSGSMTGGNLNLAKVAAKSWVNALPSGKSECSITSFDNMNYMNQDFTTDRTKLLNAINNLQANGGTDYDEGLINPMAGSLQISKSGFYKKVIVFLTDGFASEPKKQDIINEANSQDATLFAVTLGMDCPNSLRQISEQTGGEWFENVTTVDEAKQVYQQILKKAQGGNPCEIIWESKISCYYEEMVNDIDLKIKNLGITSKTSYTPPSNVIADLEFDPEWIKISKPEVGVQKDTTITVTARNADFTVTNITSTNAAFFITPTNFSLQEGQSINLTISYIPADSGYTYSKFDFENDVCPKNYYVSGGWPGKRPSVSTIKLLHPNGGEVFVAGSDIELTWEGVLPDELVKLEYRTDDLQPWVTIANSAKGLSWKFRAPNVASKKYLARVTSKSKYDGCNNPPVLLCNQIWMGCNLDVGFYRNGYPIRHAKTTEEWNDANSKQEGAWCYYNNDPANGETYGRLYNWYAINDPRGLAPEGWHIPTDEEWKELEMCLGMSQTDVDNTNWRGTDQGAQISGGTELWNDGILKNNANFDKSGFSALPTGYRNTDGTFIHKGNIARWWSTSLNNSSFVWCRNTSYISTKVFRSIYYRESGFSVRCIRD